LQDKISHIKITEEVVVILHHEVNNVKYENAEPPKIRRKIGGTMFEVSVHFSNKSKETMNDKIMRLIKNEVPRKTELAGNGAKL